ncbi:MAG TPA: hypothetical protein VFE45_04245, partial [Coriobacteriia bacterium]|nr:hypothetical protein [Coriobacteriia bacterium]
ICDWRSATTALTSAAMTPPANAIQATATDYLGFRTSGSGRPIISSPEAIIARRAGGDKGRPRPPAA